MSSNQGVVIQPRPSVRQINYLAKTFTDYRQTLIEFARAYYPDTYSDFNETSPGMMFIDMAALIADIQSFYVDNAFKENLLAYAEERENIISMAQFLGYKPKLVTPATCELTVFQIAPAILENGVYVPDKKYLIKLGRQTGFLANGTSSAFRLLENLDFSDISAENYTINTLTPGGNPSTFLVTKRAKAIQATVKTTTFSFGSPQRFTTVTLPDSAANVIGIENVQDTNGNTWYEVDYLAQDVIMEDVDVTNNQELGALPSAKLRLKKVPKRFVTRVSRDSQFELLFGSGTDNDAEVNTTLDSRQIANSQYGNTIQNVLGNVAINNVNFLNSNAYGVSPANTTLTVTYLVGGGVGGNLPANTINTIVEPQILNDTIDYESAEQTVFNSAVQTLAVTNELPASGGGTESDEEIRQNTIAFFNAQNRVVTVEDYAVRAYSMPSRFGKVAKAYAVRDEQISRIMSSYTSERTFVDNPVNPNAINLYTLGYDSIGNLTTLNTIVKENLARYLQQFRMLTDDVTILDAFIINVGVEFEISALRGYNVNDVVARSIGSVQEFFRLDKWNIGQPIILSDLMYNIGLVEGVQTVKNVRVFNKYLFKDGAGYQNYRYDIDEATINGVIYPSLDPSIFELKNPVTDIIGYATQ